MGHVFPMVISSEFRKEKYRDDDHREDAPHFMMHKLMLVTDIDDKSSQFFVAKMLTLSITRKKRDSGLNSVTNISVGKKLKMKRLTGSPPTSNNLSKS